MSFHPAARKTVINQLQGDGEGSSRKRARASYEGIKAKPAIIDLGIVDLTLDSDEDEVQVVGAKEDSINSFNGGETPNEASIGRADRKGKGKAPIQISMELDTPEEPVKMELFSQPTFLRREECFDTFQLSKTIKFFLHQITYDSPPIRAKTDLNLTLDISIAAVIALGFQPIGQVEKTYLFRLDKKSFTQTILKPVQPIIIEFLLDSSVLPEERQRYSEVRIEVSINKPGERKVDTGTIKLLDDSRNWIRDQAEALRTIPSEGEVAIIDSSFTIRDILSPTSPNLEPPQSPAKAPVQSSSGPPVKPSFIGSSRSSIQIPVLKNPIPKPGSNPLRVPPIEDPILLRPVRKPVKLPTLVGTAVKPVHFLTRMPYRKEELYDYENFDGSSISSVELLNQDTDDKIDALRLSEPLAWCHKVASRFATANPTVPERERQRACWTQYAKFIHAGGDRMKQAFFQYLNTTQFPPHIKELWKLVLILENRIEEDED